MSKLREIVNSTKRGYHFVECVTVGGVICPYIKMNGFDAYLYGVDLSADIWVSFFRDNGVPIKAIFDSDENKRGRKAKFDVPFYHDSEMRDKIDDPSNAFVIIVTRFCTGLTQVDIFNKIISAGVDKMYILSDHDKYEARVVGSSWHLDCSMFFRENVDKLEVTYDLLEDDMSKRIMEEYVRVFIENDHYKLDSGDTRNKYFYDGITVDERKDIYRHLDDEVWVNCGACFGDTLYVYFANGLDAKKVYAYEGDGVAYEDLCRNVSMLPDKYREKVVTIKEFISKGTPFADYLEEKVTLLNADIQGAELSMLQAMEDIIVRDRPVLAICIYHYAKDLVEIPQYIDSIVTDYKFVMRKYEACLSDPTRTWELVLYAVPVERYVME